MARRVGRYTKQEIDKLLRLYNEVYIDKIAKEFTSHLMMYKDLYNTAIELSKLKLSIV